MTKVLISDKLSKSAVDVFKKNKIDECYKNINLKDRGITFEERSSRLSEECKDIHTALQYFFCYYFIF